MVRAWPGESQHQRAVFGLECLRAIGTDAALMQLNGIAQKLPFKGLKAKAAELMEAIATDRGLSRTELEDRIVPDCDLDERGSRVFDFGPRQFRFALGTEMKPMVRDEAGKLKRRPAQARRQGRRRARRSRRRRTGSGSRSRSARSPRSRPNGSSRRWSPAAAGRPATSKSLLVRHPLMIHLVAPGPLGRL